MCVCVRIRIIQTMHSVSSVLRTRLRSLRLDFVGQPVGAHSVRQFYLGKRMVTRQKAGRIRGEMKYLGV